MTLQTKTRIVWIDIAKAITIFLVVFGHTLRGGMAQQIVYSFHVATFFLLSGMTCKADNMKARMKNDVLRILVPYYTFGILSILIFMVLGKFAANQLDMGVNTSLGSNLLQLLYASAKGGQIKFNMPLWFLPCLFATKMLYYALYKLCRGKQSSILVASLGIAALGFLYTHFKGPSLPFSFSVSLKMLAFFSIGRVFFLWLPAVNDRYLVGGKAFVLGFVMLVVTAVVAWFAPKVDYASDYFANIATFLVTSLIGSFGVCFVSIGIGSCKALEYVGKTTLAILAMHKFPVLLFQTVGPLKSLLTQYNSLFCIIMAMVVSLIAIAMCLVAERIIRRFLPFLLGDFYSLSRSK